MDTLNVNDIIFYNNKALELASASANVKSMVYKMIQENNIISSAVPEVNYFLGLYFQLNGQYKEMNDFYNHVNDSQDNKLISLVIINKVKSKLESGNYNLDELENELKGIRPNNIMSDLYLGEIAMKRNDITAMKYYYTDYIRKVINNDNDNKCKEYNDNIIIELVKRMGDKSDFNNSKNYYYLSFLGTNVNISNNIRAQSIYNYWQRFNKNNNIKRFDSKKFEILNDVIRQGNSPVLKKSLKLLIKLLISTDNKFYKYNTIDFVVNSLPRLFVMLTDEDIKTICETGNEYYNLARIVEWWGNEEQAFEYYSRAAKKKHNKSILTLGLFHYENRLPNQDKCLEYFSQVANSPSALSLDAKMLSIAYKLEKGYEINQITSNMDVEEIWQTCDQLYKHGRSNAAKILADNNINKQMNNKQLAKFHNLLGLVAYENKQHNQAQKHLHIAYMHDKTNMVIVYNMGVLYQDMHKYEQAKQYYEICLNNNFTDDVLENIAICNTKLQEINEIKQKCNKQGECPICYENCKLYAFSCTSHFFCVDCYQEIDKCAMCRKAK